MQYTACSKHCFGCKQQAELWKDSRKHKLKQLQQWKAFPGHSANVYRLLKQRNTKIFVNR